MTDFTEQVSEKRERWERERECGAGQAAAWNI
jgi:hypothetical protein